MRTAGARLMKHRRKAGFYCVNGQGTVCGPIIDDIEAYARENGLLKPYEEIFPAIEPYSKEATMERQEIIDRMGAAVGKLIDAGHIRHMEGLLFVLERKTKNREE